MPLYTRATMPDINVTFAGLSLRSPIAIEAQEAVLTVDTASRAAAAGAGAVFLPMFDQQRLEHQTDTEELTDNNLDDPGQRQSQRIIRRLNIQTYLETAESFVAELDVPVIAPLQCERTQIWVTLAEQLREAGVAAIELRPAVEEMSRTMRSDQIEKSILRVTASVAGRLDLPVIVRLPAGGLGLTAFVQALGEAEAAAVAIRRHTVMRSFDLNGLHLRPEPEDETGRLAAFQAQLTSCRSLYRRVNPHLAVVLPTGAPDALSAALLAGSTLGTIPVDGADSASAAQAVEQTRRRFEKWTASHDIQSLFDARGMLSESRLTSSLEQERA